MKKLKFTSIDDVRAYAEKRMERCARRHGTDMQVKAYSNICELTTHCKGLLALKQSLQDLISQSADVSRQKADIYRLVAARIVLEEKKS